MSRGTERSSECNSHNFRCAPTRGWVVLTSAPDDPSCQTIELLDGRLAGVPASATRTGSSSSAGQAPLCWSRVTKRARVKRRA
eukprot:6209393-Pleurochrysis_carterae.AAC.2